jgi:AraC family transcriptional regulator
MAAHNEAGSTADPASGAGQEWLGNSVFQVPELEISRIRSWASITAVSYHRDAGEFIRRGDRHRLILIPDQIPARPLQVEQGPTRQLPAAPPGTLTFCPAGLMLRTVQPAARFVQVLWDTDVYSALLPELGAAVSGFEFLYPLQDPLLGQIVTTLAQETDGGFADRILTESLGTALCIGIARRFVGLLPLPTSKGLSPQRLQRVRDFIEAHLDEDLSLTILADIACLSPYHFSRSFKQATGVGLHHYVMQRRIERAKTLMRRTHQPLALIALEAGFADHSHLNSAFRREIGLTPGQFRAALA